MNSIYEVEVLEHQWNNLIEKIASENEGEIPEELIEQMTKELVEKNMENMIQIDRLCRYIKHLEGTVSLAKEEETRIRAKRQVYENRIESIKRYMTPYVLGRGKFDAGTFTLSTRKSESVELVDNFRDEKYCEVVVSHKPDKMKIKDAIKAGEQIAGVRVVEKQNLQIK